MRARCLLIAAMSWAALPGCDSGPSTDDDGGPAMDGGASVDAGPRPDGGGEVDGGELPFDAGPPQPCDAPGAVESVSCGRCGSVERFCTAAGTWAYGECVGQAGECSPGSTDTITCGNCGTQEARCSATCEWEPMGECAGAGACAPGSSSRSGAGCGPRETREVTCNDVCMFEPAGACELDECSTPGAIESVACGNCGTRDRFCAVGGVWEYGTCSGEGGCTPGASEPMECGRCGSRTRRCLASCTWDETAACAGEGPCAPGATMRTDAGCPPGQTRELTCSASCGFEETSGCTAALAVDVMMLLDLTGSNGTRVDTNLELFRTQLVSPLLALGDVAVGLAYYADFPGDDGFPFFDAGIPGLGTGASTDRPFDGGIEPTVSSANLFAELSAMPTYNGGDTPESGIEALHILAGGTPPSSALPLVCSSGRAPGGCWRSGARRVIVVYTDAANHNGPDPASTGIFLPYAAGVGAASWSATQTRLMSDGTHLVTIVYPGSTDATAQHREMLTDLAQPMANFIDGTALSGALDAAVARVRTLGGL